MCVSKLISGCQLGWGACVLKLIKWKLMVPLSSFLPHRDARYSLTSEAAAAAVRILS